MPLVLPGHIIHIPFIYHFCGLLNPPPNVAPSLIGLGDNQLHGNATSLAALSSTVGAEGTEAF